MSFWTIMREYFKRVRQFYNLQREENSKSLEGGRENNIFPERIHDKQETISSSSNNVKMIDVKAEIKNVERK